MRRYDRERNDTSGGGRGFRILEAGGRYLEPLTPPPPPRAPEPYKVVPPSSSLGRAHRRSSFVIIAETRPATPCSRSPSPTFLAAGRVSPFRGRGFKGPLPHAQSRPQSPEIREENGRRGHGRYDRRASVSQQNSPKRSLIPQPTRRRSVSLPKNEERKASPKFGRRAIPLTRKNSNTKLANGGGNVLRRPSLKRPDLSPIQGTPTKPSEGGNRFRGGNSFVSGVSPVKSRNNLTVPKNNVNSRRTFGQNKSPSKVTPSSKRFIEEKKSNGEDDSPTKIPVRRGSLVNKNGSTQSLSSTRFVNKSVKPGARAVKVKPEKPETNSKVNGKGENPKGKEVDGTSEEPPRFIDMSVSPPETKKHEGDLGLIDLLKQSSGATGTSSVVNTTTTTAVQPLQIEAAGLLLEKNRAKSTEGMNGKGGATTPSPASREISPSSGLSMAPTAENSSSSTAKISKSTNGNHGTGMSEKKSENGGQKDVGVNAGSTSMTLANNSNQKNSNKANVDESSKKEQSNSANNTQGTKEGKNLVGSNAGSRKSLLTKNGIQEGSRGEMRIPSAKPGSRSSNANNNLNNNPSRSNEQTGSAKPPLNTTTDSVVASVKPSTGNGSEIVPSLVSGHQKTGSRGSAKSTNGTGNHESVDGPRTLSKNVGAAINDAEATTNNATARIAANGDNGKIRTNHGSESSLKSSNGVSNVSIESVRSTDTGVSVNTVRGVSSAREKKGVHVMKRSEEIETLSGNVMQLERNGEPAVLDIAEGAEDQQESTRLGRFKKSLARLNDRLPSMRCLGCRRNQKAHAWTGEQRSQVLEVRSDERTNVTDDNPNTGNTRCNRMWTSFKTACRCMRLRECKCCRRAARVAPEETTPCCPPERRCGAICGRLFSRCKCNRSEAQATRSIRAKHSLTSVAPPPLSEEQRAKIPEVLVEHNSVMRGAIPCLPVPIAWFCLVWNVLLPGSGTIWSGIFNLCIGQPRFAVSAGPRARFGALVVNLLVGVGQLFTVLFCLVGWGWSIWWGVIMIRLARKYKRFRASEAANSDLEARAGEQAAGLPPGVPSQALRGMERAR